MRLGRTLAELGATMSSAEFSMWLKLYEMDPWDAHIDLGFGVLAATVANYAGKMRADGAPDAQPSDYMPLPRPVEVVEEPDPIKFFGQF